MPTIWGRRNSFNVQKVLWLADELGLAYEHVPAGGGFGGLDDADFRARNPHGRVPVIDDDGTVVWESHAILRYLAARHGGERWWPADPAARSLQDRWMDWSQASLQPDFLNGVFWGFYRTPPAQRDLPRVEAAIARCADISGCWTRCWLSSPGSAARRSAWPTSPRGRRSIAISSWRSHGRRFRTSSPGTSGYRRGRGIGRT